MNNNIPLMDDEYSEFLSEYTKRYAKLVDALPPNKRGLAVNFVQISEKAIHKRYQLLINSIVEEKGSE